MVKLVPGSKHVIDEVSGWLRVHEDGSVDRTWSGRPEVVPLLTPVPPHSTSVNGVSVIDLPGEPNLRLYLPTSSTSPLPILLHFQGGGFCISHHSWFMYYQFYSRLAAAIPAVIASVDLPLAPEHRLPAAIVSSFSALLRLRSFGLSPDKNKTLPSSADFSRVFLIGDSSGGNIVHQVASLAGRIERDQPGFWYPLRVVGGIPLHPGFVRSRRSPSEARREWETPFLTLDMLDKFLALGLPDGEGKDHPYTCPMGDEAPPMEKIHVPPMLVAVAEKDLIRDTEMEYCEAMTKAGKKVEVLFQKGVGHSFYLNKFAVDGDSITAKRTEELIQAIKDFVDRN
ncbi:hypothetical protein HPP92_024684 [Vanilla planifolia]|uniref:Alpha/beta hydrolase fold-3 domain-containing protein n=1 Tax=Vanilla planifolia TaxID=51239 RepID=A0A835PGG7_VANPL|nr:hypothetical protein HPP92_024684 [Vanilla planifolia]